MTKEELQSLIKGDAKTFVEDYLFAEEAPYVCEGDDGVWTDFRDAFSRTLDISKSDVRVVGSGRFGFSLAPWKIFKPFDDRSDIDVVVVNADLFDAVWIGLLTVAYPRREAKDLISGWLVRVRNEVYTGYISPHAISIDHKIFGTKANPISNFQTRWFNAQKIAANADVRPHETVKARLYRTWAHALAYHEDSVVSLKDLLNGNR